MRLLEGFIMNSVKVVWLLVMVLGLNGFVTGRRPAVVNVGAVLTYNSIIGGVAKIAIEAAVADVNANAHVLDGTRLNLIMEDANCSAFIGSVAALKVLDRDAVAVIGPQSSSIAHIISYISNGLQIPFVSFAATDPTLSSPQFPFFLRMTQSDSYQMAAMADLIDYYGWRQVIGIFVDDDYGRNGIYSLDDELAKKTSNIYKFALPIGAPQDTISDLLRKSRLIGPRVYVVHATPDTGLEIFSEAYHLQMMTDEYVWLATDWFCTALDTSGSISHKSLHYLQGVVGLRQYIPQSSRKNAFVSQWSELNRNGMASSKLNTYAVYAYDAVWAVAHAISDFLDEFGNITFSNSKLGNMKGNLRLDKLRTFDGGSLLLKKLLLLNFTGLTGQIQFDSDQNLISGNYEVINIYDSMIQKVGYWANHSGLSISSPESSYRKNVEPDLANITWPGGRTATPRGWVVANSERPLRIGVPYRASFVDFVSVLTKNHTVKGFCIDVFDAAVKLVPYDVPYQLVPIGNGRSNPNYDKLVNMVLEDVIDAVVGDISIVTNRTKVVDFTQPYIFAGLVIVAPIKSTKSSAWVFLRPFTLGMWCTTGSFFFLIGVVIWLLEHRVNCDFRGPPKRQCITMFLFSFSTLFKSQKEVTLSTLGRFVMMLWLFLLMVITSSYTASLTSFLTVQQLSSPIKGIDSLIASNEPIGYQVGSFARTYLIDCLNVHPSRLRSLGSPNEYEAALKLGPKNGGVAAIIDERPYVEVFLSERSGFGIVGQPFTWSGWGFAFPRGSPLAVDLSRAILELSENGKLQRIHDKWFGKTSYNAQASSSSETIQLNLRSFWGLFLVCGAATIASFLLFLLRAIYQFIRFHRKHIDPSKLSSKGCSQVISSFFDFIDEKEEAIKNMFKQQNNSSSSGFSDQMLQLLLFAIEDLRKLLKDQGSDLLIGFGSAEDVILKLVNEVKATRIFLEEEVEYKHRRVINIVQSSLSAVTFPWGGPEFVFWTTPFYDVKNVEELPVSCNGFQKLQLPLTNPISAPALTVLNVEQDRGSLPTVDYLKEYLSGKTCQTDENWNSPKKISAKTILRKEPISQDEVKIDLINGDESFGGKSTEVKLRSSNAQKTMSVFASPKGNQVRGGTDIVLNALAAYLRYLEGTARDDWQELHAKVRLAESREGTSFGGLFGSSLYLGIISRRRVHYEAIKYEKERNAGFISPFGYSAPTVAAAVDTVCSMEWYWLLALKSQTCNDGLYPIRIWRWNGYLIQYTVVGNEGPAVVFVHGFGAFLEHFRGNITSVVDDGHRVWGITLLGFGRSEKPNLVYKELMWAELLRDFIVEVVGEPVHLIGNSIGGYFVAAVAGLWPALAKSIVLINTAGSVVPNYPSTPLIEEGQTSGIAWLGSRLLLLYLRLRARDILKSCYPTKTERVDDWLVNEILRASYDPGAPIVLESIFNFKLPVPLNYFLDSFGGKVLVVQGMRDPLSKSEKRLSMLREHCSWVTIKEVDAGHCPHDELPEEVNLILSEWTKTA